MACETTPWLVPAPRLRYEGKLLQDGSLGINAKLFVLLCITSEEFGLLSQAAGGEGCLGRVCLINRTPQITMPRAATTPGASNTPLEHSVRGSHDSSN